MKPLDTVRKCQEERLKVLRVLLHPFGASCPIAVVEVHLLALLDEGASDAILCAVSFVEV
jgi:hypothetical protein